jgi:spermidine/putrescine transport system substrate-binding protein
MRILCLISILAFLFSCTKNSDSHKPHELNLAIWGNYLTPEVQKGFTEKTGIKLNITNYSSNEELLAKVQMGNSGIDVAVPSDYMVDIMTKLNLLDSIDKSQIPNFKNLDPQHLNASFDPGNVHSIPYGWTTTGIAVNRSLYKGSIKGWKDILENPVLAGKFSLLDDMREVIGMALKVNGKSVNSQDPKDLAEAEALLLKIKKNVKTFTSDTIETLKSKEVLVAQAYSVDALQAAAKGNSEIEYIIPEEGATKSIDNLVILKNAKNKAQAHQFINYLLEPEIDLSFVKNIRSGPVLKGISEMLPSDLKNNKALFPSAETLSKQERIIDLGASNQLMEKIWTKLKTH